MSGALTSVWRTATLWRSPPSTARCCANAPGSFAPRASPIAVSTSDARLPALLPAVVGGAPTGASKPTAGACGRPPTSGVPVPTLGAETVGTDGVVGAPALDVTVAPTVAPTGSAGVAGSL